ncbi:MAG: phosphoribosylglycinamide formyltransferase, partial [Heliobacteriaceae bacterium]|nr:phosphoribosylglycinamide formyltransferase [Heliobacteriaceae bacterium]
MKIAVMGSGNGSNFEAVAQHFGDSVEITCLSDVEDAYILERAQKLNVQHKYLPFEQNFEYFTKNKFDLIVLAGYMQILPPEVLALGRFVNIHPSLLPAFKGKDAIKQAYLAGVKVSGVTVHWVEKDIDCGKIIAQYPVLIGNLTHFDEFEREIHAIEHALYPVVIEKILNDEVFDFSD